MVKKLRQISKFMTSQTGQQTIIIHILPDTSRKKGHQTLTFAQEIECKMVNIFFHAQYVVEKLVPDHFFKKKSLNNLKVV